LIVLVVVLVVGVAVGLVTAAVLRRWPQVDPASPSVAAHAATDVAEQHPVARSFVQKRLDPATTTGLLLTVLLGVALVGVVAAGLLLVMIKTNSGFARWDEAAGQWGADHATNTSARILRDISLIGGTSISVLAGLTVAIVQTLRTHRREIFAFLVTVFVGITVVVNVTKWIVHRDRPDIRRLTGFSGSSFPSGHAATAAATLAALALVIGLGCSPRTKAVVAGAAAGIAAAVASTRVLLGVHWLTDVMAGLAVGWAWFCLCSLAFGGRLLRFGAPVAAAEKAAEQEEPSGAARH
jgi:membrane-associated phospholipid phosphatase